MKKSTYRLIRFGTPILCLLLLVPAVFMFSACNDTTIIGDETSVPSIETSGSVETKEEREACYCEELEYQIDAYDHPDLPDEMDAFPQYPLLKFYSFEEYVGERFYDNQPVNVVLATFKGIEDETNESFHVKFAVDKVYAGEIVSEEIEVKLYRGRTEISRSEWDRLLGLYSEWPDFQSILCPYEENEQYLLILDRRSGTYETTNAMYTIVIPADDVKHSRMFGRWLKELTDFDLENCDNVDDFAQYVVNVTSVTEA